jgi:hypothetical protein
MTLITQKCASQVHPALEYMTVSSRWETIWSTWDDESDEDITVHSTHISWMIELSHEEYVTDIQREFETDESSTTVQLRFVYRDGNENVITGLEATFEVVINDNGDVDEDCAAAEVEFVTKPRDIQLAFDVMADGTASYKTVEIPKTLETKFTDTTVDC